MTETIPEAQAEKDRLADRLMRTPNGNWFGAKGERRLNKGMLLVVLAIGLSIFYPPAAFIVGMMAVSALVLSMVLNVTGALTPIFRVGQLVLGNKMIDLKYARRQRAGPSQMQMPKAGITNPYAPSHSNSNGIERVK